MTLWDLIWGDWERTRNGLDATRLFYHPDSPPPNEPILRCEVTSWPTQRVWSYSVYEYRMANGIVVWEGDYSNLSEALRAWRQLT